MADPEDRAGGGAKGVWDAVDTSRDLWGQNVLETFEMAIRHKQRSTRTELERGFAAGFILTQLLT